jgi:hypothetical protein
VTHDLTSARPIVDHVEGVDVDDEAGGQRDRLAAVDDRPNGTVERPADEL